MCEERAAWARKIKRRFADAAAAKARADKTDEVRTLESVLFGKVQNLFGKLVWIFEKLKTCLDFRFRIFGYFLEVAGDKQHKIIKNIIPTIIKVTIKIKNPFYIL